MKTSGESGSMAELQKDGAEAVISSTSTPKQSEMEPPDMPTAKSTKAPAFQFYAKDFLTSPKVRRMSLAERGAYITLLALCWLDGSLPTDHTELAFELRIPRAQFDRMWNGTLGQCFIERGGRYFNERLNDERKKQDDFRRRASDWGKKGGRPKAEKGSLSNPQSTNGKLSDLQSPISNLRSPDVPTPKNGVGTARHQPIIAPRRKDAAWEGRRLYVPQRAHNDMVALRNSPNAVSELVALYERLDAEWSDGASRDRNPGSDMIRFWKARYDEAWPPEAAPVVDGRTPAWAR